jgi:uncharacterized repeat protein (TIGR04138 family)
VRETIDWGRIVFLLVDQGLLKRQDDDTIEDFRDDADFDALFVDGYRAKLAELLAAREGGRAEGG